MPLLVSLVFAIFAVYRVEETRYGRDGVSVSFRRVISESYMHSVETAVMRLLVLGVFAIVSATDFAFVSAYAPPYSNVASRVYGVRHLVSAGSFTRVGHDGNPSNGGSSDNKGVRPNPRKPCTAYIERNATIAAFAVWPAGVGPALQLLYFFASCRFGGNVSCYGRRWQSVRKPSWCFSGCSRTP